MPTTKQIIQAIKSDMDGQIEIDLEGLKDLYIELGRPQTKIIKMEKVCYVAFVDNPKVQLKVTNIKGLGVFAFVEKCECIDVMEKAQNIFQFIASEFWQGHSVFEKILRLVLMIGLLFAFNTIVFTFADFDTIRSTFTGLLTAVSIFIAIFSLFTINNDHWKRKEVALFESKKLAYYYSVDKNITELGIVAIIVTIFGLLLTRTGENINLILTQINAFEDLRNWFIFLFLNFSFIAIFILLKSITEFYIHRPAKFILGKLKDVSLENLRKDE